MMIVQQQQPVWPMIIIILVAVCDNDGEDHVDHDDDSMLQNTKKINIIGIIIAKTTTHKPDV